MSESLVSLPVIRIMYSRSATACDIFMFSFCRSVPVYFVYVQMYLVWSINMLFRKLCTNF